MAKVKEFEFEYNPVKELKGNEKAQAVVWSTKSINAAVEAIKKGLPLKANPFIGPNTKLLRPDLVYKRTPEEIEDYVKCMNDPVYFASKCFLMTPEGLQSVTLRDYQVDYLNHLNSNNFSIFLSCRLSGKTLNLLTTVSIKFDKNDKKLARLLKKYYYYIIDNDVYIDVPIFELYYIYNKSFINKCRYQLYNLIYRLQLWQAKKDKKSKNLKS